MSGAVDVDGAFCVVALARALIGDLCDLLLKILLHSIAHCDACNEAGADKQRANHGSTHVAPPITFRASAHRWH